MPEMMRAADLTVAQLRESLAQVYGSELKNPDVTVTVRTFGSNTVYVMGEVGHPGMLPLSGSMTALQAITAAEGFKSSGQDWRRPADPTHGPGTRQLADPEPWKGIGIGGLHRRFAAGALTTFFTCRVLPIGNVDEFVDLYMRRILPIQPGIQVPVS